MGKIIWIIIAFLAGAFLPLQGGFNALLGKEAKSPLHAYVFFYHWNYFDRIIYSHYKAICFPGRREECTVVRMVRGLVWGFLFNGNYTYDAKIGTGLTFGLIVAGQMIISVLLEHFNILVTQPHPISFLRVVGILLVVGGVIIIRVF